MEELVLFDAAPDLNAVQRCSRCGKAKPLATAFRKRSAGKRRAECKDCQYAKEKAWRDAQTPEYRRERAQWQLYRLPWADYLEMLERQRNACAICRRPLGDNPKLIHVDHDHGCAHAEKGVKCCRACVRGILCNHCNMFVGWIENEHRRLADVLDYLGANGVVIWAQIVRDLGYETIGPLSHSQPNVPG